MFASISLVELGFGGLASTGWSIVAPLVFHGLSTSALSIVKARLYTSPMVVECTTPEGQRLLVGPAQRSGFLFLLLAASGVKWCMHSCALVHS